MNCLVGIALLCEFAQPHIHVARSDVLHIQLTEVRKNARVNGVLVGTVSTALEIRLHDIFKPCGEIITQIHTLRRDADVAALPVGVCFNACLVCVVFDGLLNLSKRKGGQRR